MLGGNHVTGEKNVLISGSDNNTSINVFSSIPPILTKSQVYKLLELVISALNDTDSQPQVSLEMPAQITEKLLHNSAHAYIDIFEMQIEYFNIIDESSQSMVASELIIKQLQRLYFRQAERDAQGKILTGNGDLQLDNVKNELFEIIIQDPDYVPDITREQVEDFIEALMLYGVWKCKILENPNRVI